MRKLLLLLTLGLGLWTLDAFSATYYVSKTGSNANACSTTDSAGTNKLTITAGIGCMTVAGDTLYVHTGTYAETIDTNNTLIRSGTSWNNLTSIRAYPSEVVTINGAFNLAVSSLNTTLKYLLIDGFKFNTPNGTDVAVSLYSGSTPPFPDMFIRVSNVEIINAGGPAEVPVNPGNCGHGVEVHASGNEFLNMSVHDSNTACGSNVHGFYVNGRNNLVDHCQMYNNSGYGLQFYNATGGADNNIVRFCLVHDNGFATNGQANRGGIALYQGTGNQAYNNIVYGNATYGIVISESCVSCKAQNNTINNTNGGIQIGVSGGLTPSPSVQNNIMYPAGLTNGGTSGSPSIDHNLTTNPTWSDATVHDYHILTASAAKDTGTTIAAITTDYDGFTRPQGSAYDIGAYEFITNIPPPISTIAVTFPNGGESMVVGTDVNITWTTNGTDNVKIEASRDGGLTYLTGELICSSCAQVVGSTNVRVWTPTAPRTSAFRVKITNLTDGAVDSSDADATVHGSYVK